MDALADQVARRTAGQRGPCSMRSFEVLLLQPTHDATEGNSRLKGKEDPNSL